MIGEQFYLIIIACAFSNRSIFAHFGKGHTYFFPRLFLYLLAEISKILEFGKIGAILTGKSHLIFVLRPMFVRSSRGKGHDLCRLPLQEFESAELLGALQKFSLYSVFSQTHA
jgi:hypothetical protein